MALEDVSLAAGYALAVPFSLYPPGFLRLWRRREPALIAAEEAGVALICLGWLVKGRWGSVAINGTWGAGLALAYLAEGRKRRAG